MKLLVASLCGAGLAALLQFFVAPDLGGEWMGRERAFVLFAGCLAPAVLVGIWARIRGWEREAALVGGFTLGCASLFSQFGLGMVGGLAAGVVLTSVAPRFGRKFALIGATSALGAFAVLLAPVYTAFGMQPHAVSGTQVLAPSLAPPSSSVAAAQGADYLLILADTLRADVILEDEVPTPNLDRLRAEGMWAPFGVASNAQTRPSHLTLLLGMDVERHGMVGNAGSWPKAEQIVQQGGVPLAQRFNEAGWRTVGLAANPVLALTKKMADPEREGLQDFAQGFETWHVRKVVSVWDDFGPWKADHTWFGWVTNVYPGNVQINKVLSELFDPDGFRIVRDHRHEGGDISEQAVRYLDGLYETEQPWFLFLHFQDPHAPYVPPPAFHGTISDPTGLPAGTNVSPEGEYDLRDKLRLMLRDEGARPDDWAPYAEYLHDLYREEVAYLDAQIGKVLDRVRQSGRPTVIVFTSDHGEMFGEHGWKEHGHTLHRGEVEVPFIVQGAGVPAGQLPVIPELVDVAATLLAHAGLAREGVDGRNLLDDPQPRPIFTRQDVLAGIRADDWRAHFGVDYGAEPTRNQYDVQQLLLHDLTVDPQERRNLATFEAQRFERLETMLRARLADDLYPDLTIRVLERGEKDKLVELGYFDDDEGK